VKGALPSSDLRQLDEYSQVAAQRILERFPDWRTRIVLRRPNGYDHAFADFELPCPSPAIEHGLWVSTADEEITVGLHTYHTHFTNYNEGFDAQHIDDALDHVQELLDERTVIVSWYSGERFAGSSSVDAAVAEAAPSFISGVTRTTRRSWRGTYDQSTENA
jgi:hypothetical protein